MKNVFAVLFLLLVCTGALAEPVTVTDMMGREVTLSEPAERVVALTAADCEILCALGCEEALVGRGQYCDYPESILEVPSVESGSNTNLEEIIALDPQVVLMSTMAQTTEQSERLAQAGIGTVISNASDIEGTYEAIRIIGQLMGKSQEAEALVSEMADTFRRVSEKAGDSGKTVYFEVSPLQYGLWTAGKGTFMDELARMCGLRNAFEDVEGWAQISEEQVLERDPDYIVTITMYFGKGPTPVEEICQRAGWENLRAVQNHAILNADSNVISRPGPRLMEAAQVLLDFITEAQNLDSAA